MCIDICKTVGYVAYFMTEGVNKKARIADVGRT